jgi:hypothetical protein
MPPAAVSDFLEWDKNSTAQQQFGRLLNHELRLDDLISPAPGVQPLQDDRPINEYWVMRRMGNREYLAATWRSTIARIEGKTQPQ